MLNDIAETLNYLAQAQFCKHHLAQIETGHGIDEINSTFKNHFRLNSGALIEGVAINRALVMVARYYWYVECKNTVIDDRIVEVIENVKQWYVDVFGFYVKHLSKCATGNTITKKETAFCAKYNIESGIYVKASKKWNKEGIHKTPFDFNIDCRLKEAIALGEYDYPQDFSWPNTADLVDASEIANKYQQNLYFPRNIYNEIIDDSHNNKSSTILKIIALFLYYRHHADVTDNQAPIIPLKISEFGSWIKYSSPSEPFKTGKELKKKYFSTFALEKSTNAQKSIFVKAQYYSRFVQWESPYNGVKPLNKQWVTLIDDGVKIVLKD